MSVNGRGQKSAISVFVQAIVTCAVTPKMMEITEIMNMMKNNDDLHRTLISDAILLVSILLLMCSIYIMCSCRYDAAPEKETIRSTIIIDRAQSNNEQTIEDLLYKKENLDVPFVSQYPDLPTGCEVTSLTMMLNYLGYDVESTEIVDDYLLYWDPDYQVGFRGSPYFEDGGTIWPPALVTTGNNYLDEQESEYSFIDVSDTNFEKLLEYIDSGYPVALWVTETFSTIINYDGIISEYNGKEYKSFWGVHCVLLVGYDREQGIAVINNPQREREEVDLYQLWSVYDACGRYAITIKENKNE